MGQLGARRKNIEIRKGPSASLVDFLITVLIPSAAYPCLCDAVRGMVDALINRSTFRHNHIRVPRTAPSVIFAYCQNSAGVSFPGDDLAVIASTFSTFNDSSCFCALPRWVLFRVAYAATNR